VSTRVHQGLDMHDSGSSCAEPSPPRSTFSLESLPRSFDFVYGSNPTKAKKLRTCTFCQLLDVFRCAGYCTSKSDADVRPTRGSRDSHSQDRIVSKQAIMFPSSPFLKVNLFGSSSPCRKIRVEYRSLLIC
jgi:hypothetical protein